MIDVEFDLSRLVLRGKSWGNSKGLPVIALHGWLDNCASFDLVAPKLNHLNLVALDMAGHGQSDNRGCLGAYNIWQDVTEILAVAELLEWRTFGVIGHSRGAMVATVLASAFPDRITHLGLIESVLPHTVEAEKFSDQLIDSFKSTFKLRNRPRNHYSTYDAAIKAREEGFIPLSHQDACVLARRGVCSDQTGYYWKSDPLLLAPSEIKFTVEQVIALTSRITIPVQVLIGEEGMLIQNQSTQEWLSSRSNFNVNVFPGNHHLHMSQQCDAVAENLSSYFV